MRYSALAAGAQEFLLPTRLRRDLAGRRRPQNGPKALVGSSESLDTLLLCSSEAALV